MLKIIFNRSLFVLDYFHEPVPILLCNQLIYVADFIWTSIGTEGLFMPDNWFMCAMNMHCWMMNSLHIVSWLIARWCMSWLFVARWCMEGMVMVICGSFDRSRSATAS